PIAPDLYQGHGLLATLYQQVGGLDAGFAHMQEFERIQRQRGPRPGESADAFTERIELLAGDVARLERELFNRENAYELREGGLSLAMRARLAQSVGLPRKALELLLHSEAGGGVGGGIDPGPATQVGSGRPARGCTPSGGRPKERSWPSTLPSVAAYP